MKKAESKLLDIEEIRGAMVYHLAKIDVEFTVWANELAALRILAEHNGWDLPNTIQTVLHEGIIKVIDDGYRHPRTPKERNRLRTMMGLAPLPTSSPDGERKKGRKSGGSAAL